MARDAKTVDDLPGVLYSWSVELPKGATMGTAPLTEARDKLSEIVDQVAASADVFTVTKHGKPMAVVLGYEEYESLIETLNILADSATMEALNEARAEDDEESGV
ncbi:type II toxin-antitoxin system Phd/YefM family antitoxin [Frankia sp. CiP3]|uniref:type II toxin-antitoxin system Phd/YefM family antitoxin n=1 Tax=Frankia sp. CiP3 TaxID=2880971 RepID=UPI001EF4687A|nr:type II toxin-antitoxin system Phd/YefM family antitoxin [Frankia sp. CiP3]